MEYLIAGTGVVIKFEGEDELESTKNLGEDGFITSGNLQNSELQISPATTKTSIGPEAATGKLERIGILSCDEVDVNLKRIRRLSGDETHQGRHVRISPDDFKILHVKLYPYH